MIDFGPEQQKLHTGKHPMGLAHWRSRVVRRENE
jgi:hypothetical protein